MKTFQQYDKEIKNYEEWKAKLAEEDGGISKVHIQIPEVNVESQMVVDDVFEFEKQKEYWLSDLILINLLGSTKK